MSRPWMVTACVAYAVLIAGIVLVANVGGTGAMFGFVRHVPFGDKIGHFVLIGVLALLVDRVWRRERRVFRWRVPLAAVAVGALALAEELTQIALPTRTFDLADLAADWLGIAAFVGLGRWLHARREREAPPAPG